MMLQLRSAPGIHARVRVPAGGLSAVRCVRFQSSKFKPYYITTPIFYVNASPHVGHLYSMVLADTFKRWQQFRGRETYMLTGTDEHGMKVQQVAQEKGQDPKEFCDEVSVTFKNLASAANISNDRFIRTTDPDHIASVHKFWNRLVERGYIYKGEHKGWYCVSDETFYPENLTEERVDHSTGLPKRVAIETGKTVEWTSEENYFFAMSKMKQRLLGIYESRPKFVVPRQRFKEVKAEVADSTGDLSISRPSSRYTWGIRVPGDDSQTIYVWLDALVNYLTATGYSTSEECPLWPANTHVIGKDIIRFHAMYWPAFLLAAGYQIPKRILVHGHWQMNGAKMSKSDGNVVDPFYILNLLDTDAARYYLLSHAIVDRDCSFSTEAALERRRTDLVGKYGNLISRVTSKTFSLEIAVSQIMEQTGGDFATFQAFEQTKYIGGLEADLITSLNELYEKLIVHMHYNHDTPSALRDIWAVLGAANRYVDLAEPWKAKSKRLLYQTIFVLGEVGRISSILLQPFLPEYAARGLDQLGVRPERRTPEYAKFMADDFYGNDANRGKHIMKVIR
ncbi:tRNA synthetases class I (M)-domain-containing protein [Myxozyma melibiosi]|uniref:methionine--tRNA ligase n=1 Tax=Myxozyma melibiosi TaxID=54550 RepID=A0ABR1F984_9ASCO